VTGSDGENGESMGEFMALNVAAFHANFEASLTIARDFDEWADEALSELEEEEG
jgi:hypothetical protein